MDLSQRSDLKQALRLAGISPNKKLSQHFLVDPHVLAKIVKTAQLNKADWVVEIGPGLGTLTSELAKVSSQVVAIERDKQFVKILNRLARPNVQIIEQDFLDFNLATLPADYKIVANLPYSITAAVFRKLLTARVKPKRVTVLVQKEVAERITASPGQLSILALSVQYYGRASLLQLVPKTSFWPVPKVDSALLDIELLARPVFSANTAKLFRLIRIGFSAKRKMLKNNLAVGFNQEASVVITILNKASVRLTARAQELSLSDWQKLYHQLTDAKLL